MSVNDVKITCQDCKKDFIFTEAEQHFYEEKGFTPPKRCKACRNARTLRFNNKYYNNSNQKGEKNNA